MSNNILCNNIHDYSLVERMIILWNRLWDYLWDWSDWNGSDISIKLSHKYYIFTQKYYTLHHFSGIFRLQINHSNSRLFAAAVTDEDLTAMQNITGFPLGEFPVRYLGLPLIHGKLKTSHFDPLIKKSLRILRNGLLIPSPMRGDWSLFLQLFRAYNLFGSALSLSNYYY